MIVFIFHTFLALLICCGCLFAFLRRKTHGFWAYFLLGWALQVLLSIPAGIWQGIFAWPHIDVSGFMARILTPFVGWPFNAGGYTIRWIFEATVVPLEWLVGHRSATVLSNMPYYLFLMVFQGSIIAIIFAIRYKRRKTLKDWIPICLGILFLINSFVNVKWFWAGT